MAHIIVGTLKVTGVQLKVPDHGFRRPFRKISMSALWCASRLDYNCYVMIKKRVRDVLDDAFAAIKAAPSIISLFGAISIDEDWNDIRLLLVACEDLEKMDNIIIRPKFIKALEELARNCPDHQRHCNQIRGTATILHELVRLHMSSNVSAQDVVSQNASLLSRYT